MAAGAEIIQLDEPARGNVSGEEMARLYNLATEGVKAKLAFHVCFGNRFGRSRFDRSYRPYFPGLLKARADQFVLEFAGRELSELDVWKEYGAGRELGAGVIDVKGFYPDSPEDVARRIRRVLTVCPAEKLWLNPDCGFGWSALHGKPEGRNAGRGHALAHSQLTEEVAPVDSRPTPGKGVSTPRQITDGNGREAPIAGPQASRNGEAEASRHVERPMPRPGRARRSKLSASAWVAVAPMGAGRAGHPRRFQGPASSPITNGCARQRPTPGCRQRRIRAEMLHPHRRVDQDHFPFGGAGAAVAGVTAR